MGLAARIVASNESALAKEPEVLIEPSRAEHRIGILFDDSGSMCGQKIVNARAGVEEFLRSCERNKTAVTIYPMCAPKLELSSNLPALAILCAQIQATGGTPFIQRLERMLQENELTRAIAFSDGFPDPYTDSEYRQVLEYKIPVDTVSIGGAGADFMKNLAQSTGGIHLQFSAGASNFRTAFKYLSPGLRYMLADKSFVDSIQKG